MSLFEYINQNKIMDFSTKRIYDRGCVFSAEGSFLFLKKNATLKQPLTIP
jgi:hypothetical protein